MIVFGEATFMLPRVIFFWGSAPEVMFLFPTFLKRSCCCNLSVCASDPPTLVWKLLWRDLPSNALNPKIFIFVTLGAPPIKHEPGWFKRSTFDGASRRRSGGSCLFVSVCLFLCRISGQLNLRCCKRLFQRRMSRFSRMKNAVFFSTVGVIRSQITSFFLSQVQKFNLQIFNSLKIVFLL